MSENVKKEKDLTAEIKNLVVEFRTDYGAEMESQSIMLWKL